MHKQLAAKPFQYFFRLLDVACLEVAYLVAYLTVPRILNALFVDDAAVPAGTVASMMVFLIPLVWLPVLQMRGLYGDPALIPYRQIVSEMLMVTAIGLGAVTLILFAFRQPELSRLLLFVFSAYSFLVLLAAHATAKAYFAGRHRAGYYSQKLIVVGCGEDAQRLLSIVADANTLNDFDVLGYLDGQDSDGGVESQLPHLGCWHDLAQEVAKRHVDEVLVIWDAQEKQELDLVLDACREMGTRVRIIPRFALDYATRALSDVVARAESWWDLPSIVLSTVKWKPEQEFVKRLMDVLLAGALLIVLSPLLLIVAGLVKLTSRGPVFYRWRVLGRNNREFVGYKFRTMVSNADDLKAALLKANEMQGPVFKIKNDPRITPVGRVLRKYSLDELPQLWSVFKGDMSLVGPRPVFRSEFERFQFWQMRKLSVRPGMTCFWQVNGRNKIADFSEWIRLDLKYIDNWTLWLDLKILALTALAVVKGTGH